MKPGTIDLELVVVIDENLILLYAVPYLISILHIFQC